MPHSALDLVSETGSVMGPHFFLSALPSGRSLLAFLITGKKGSFLKVHCFKNVSIVFKHVHGG